MLDIAGNRAFPYGKVEPSTTRGAPSGASSLVPGGAMATVDLEQINKLYPNGFHAVKDLSLDVHDGEFMVLVGPSGCGKTTALRMVSANPMFSPTVMCGYSA